MANVGRDAGGNLVFASASAGTTIYPFTYLAALAGFVGVTAAVLPQRPRTRLAIVGAALVGYVSVVGMINGYEQVFLLGLTTQTHSTAWWTADWGTLGSAAFSFVGLTWSLASLPWWRRANLDLAGSLAAVFVGTMALWILLGFPSVQSGLPWVYAANAVSRGAATMIPVALVAPDRWRVRFHAFVGAIAPTLRGPGDASAQRSRPPAGDPDPASA